MPWSSRIESNKSIINTEYKILLVDINNIRNINICDNNIVINKNFPYYIIKYTDILSHKFFIEYINKSSVNTLNMYLLYDTQEQGLNTRGGYVSLMLMEIIEIPYNDKILSNTVSLQTIFMIYKFIYNSNIIKTNLYNYNIMIDNSIRIKKFDSILIKFLNSPSSQSDVMNSILLYRSFPIFNYIMYLNRKQFCNVTNPSFDFVFDNPNVLNTTCLNYMLTETSDIKDYISNIKHLVNMNLNILDYNLYVSDVTILTDNKINIIYNRLNGIINDQNTNILLEREEEDTSIDITINATDILNENSYNIVIEEIRLDYGKSYNDLYFNINQLLNLPSITPNRSIYEISISDKGLDKEILRNLRNKNNSITKDDIKRLLVRGLLRFYIEAFTCLLILSVNKESNRNMEFLSRYNELNIDITPDYITYDRISLINEIKMNILNDYYKYTINKDKFKLLYSSMGYASNIIENIYAYINPNQIDNNTEQADIVNNPEQINDRDLRYIIDLNNTNSILTKTVNVCYYKNLFISLYNNKFETQISLIKKFNNTITLMNTIKNNKNYPLYIFLLFSNINVKVLMEPLNNNICKSLDNIFSTKYCAYIRNT
ncbi:unknown similar to AMEV044 [Mythimna separata entomopoxvirus 'L']|uniref:Uncharacterized protein n=1 Tax=Mythimna separata entomopoxvirus 'L' TaxID=1293572 RepID=A0A916KQ63_9POXV|nr:unknown similar to AMEV044 [Mythimna separata entomopoxvirus 'L']CCU56268.1 unknown similar to AMEV044 [Mythimna separata entomopoxvirus 'L']